jgi:predicted dehydrogenase
MGQIYARHLARRVPQAHLVAVADVIEERARTLAFPEPNSVGDIDNAVVNMRFQGGALGNVEVSRNALYGCDIRTEILGTEGGLNVGYYQETPLLVMTRQGISHDMVPYIIQRFGDAYLAQTRDFVERVLEDREPAVTGADARAALENDPPNRIRRLKPKRPLRAYEASA